ncbi:sulfotransferase family 2 domain-containing protein [Sagittula sp. SSi028]|uniref:sulfotransferase family 2 domain-containing protein n=1 Tax=Sagittula sp. SSi028 TaxID=3400636 RepID=UPI003AF5A7E1
MPLLSKRNRHFFFIHIPKTGGSFIESSAKKNGWRLSLILNGYTVSESGFLKISPQHLHAELYEQLIDVSSTIELFTVVRHPFDRFKSEYYWQRKQNRTLKDPDDWIGSMFEAYNRSKCAFDNHIRPQCDFLPSSGECQVHKLEENGINEALIKLDVHRAPSFMEALKLPFIRSKSKKSVYEPVIEAAFNKRRKEIEDFYSADMTRFKYDSEIQT